MADDKLRLVYNTLRGDKNLGSEYKGVSYDQFKEVITTNPDARKGVFSDLKAQNLVSRDNADDYWAAVGIGSGQPPKVSLAPPTPTNPSSQTASQVAGKPVQVQQRPTDTPYFKQWESQAQLQQEAKSPVFRDNALAQQAIQSGLIMPTRESEEAFNKKTLEEQQQIIQGSSGFQRSQEKANERRTIGQKAKDFVKTVGGIASNAYDAILQSERLLGAKQRELFSFGERSAPAKENLQRVKQEVIRSMGQIENQYAQDLAANNIQTSLIDAVNSGKLSQLPEAIGYNVANALISGFSAAGTGGYSMFAQTLADEYKNGVENLARETGRTPEQVIAAGDDAELIPTLSAGFQGVLESAQIGLATDALKNRGAYKAIRDAVVKKSGKKAWAAAAGISATAVESGLQGLEQELTSIAAEEAAGSDSASRFYDKLMTTLGSDAGKKRLAESFVGEAIGAGGIVGGGKTIQEVLGAMKNPKAVNTIEDVPVAAQESAVEVNTPEGKKLVYDDIESIDTQPQTGQDKAVTVTPEEFQAYQAGTIDPERQAGLADDVAKGVTPESIAESDPLYARMLAAEYAKQEAPLDLDAELAALEGLQTQPLNIDFAKNEGRNVDYQGIQGRIKIDSDGAPYVFTKDGDVVYIEGGLSGQTPQQLGLKALPDDVINEQDIEQVVQDEAAPLDQNQMEYDFDNNTVTLYGRPFVYEGVETNQNGQTTALRLKDANGKTKFVRNEDTILEFEIQKELYEKSRSNRPATLQSAVAAAEQLQVAPISRPQQVSEPVQQEGPTGDTESDALDLDAELAALEGLQMEDEEAAPGFDEEIPEESVQLPDDESAVEADSAIPATPEDIGNEAAPAGVDTEPVEPGGPENQGEVVSEEPQEQPIVKQPAVPLTTGEGKEGEIPKTGDRILTSFAGPYETVVKVQDGKVYATPEGSKTGSKNIYSIEEWNEFSGKQAEFKAEQEKSEAAANERAAKEQAKQEAEQDIDGYGEDLSPIEKGKAKAFLNKTLFGKTVKQALKDYAAKGAYVYSGKIAFDENGQRVFIDNRYQTKTGVGYFEHIKSEAKPEVQAKPQGRSSDDFYRRAKENSERFKDISDAKAIEIASKFYVYPDMNGAKAREFLVDGYTRAENNPGASSSMDKLVEEVDKALVSGVISDFDSAQSLKGEEGRAARKALRESMGKEKYKDLETITNRFDSIAKDLESRGIWKIDCP